MSKKHVIFIVIVFFVVVTGFIYYESTSSRDDLVLSESSLETKQPDSENEGKEKEEDGGKDSQNICVHICGYVKKPGVYKLKSDARIVDAINAAGGLLNLADEVAINQAKSLKDGEQIYIPSKDEAKLEDKISSNVDDIKNDSSTINKSNGTDNSKVNINIASKDELMTLPGIGEAKATRIIEYRDKNGSFNKIDDIMNITGIKEGLFKKISEYITV